MTKINIDCTIVIILVIILNKIMIRISQFWNHPNLSKMWKNQEKQLKNYFHEKHENRL